MVLAVRINIPELAETQEGAGLYKAHHLLLKASPPRRFSWISLPHRQNQPGQGTYGLQPGAGSEVCGDHGPLDRRAQFRPLQENSTRTLSTRFSISNS